MENGNGRGGLISILLQSCGKFLSIAVKKFGEQVFSIVLLIAAVIALGYFLNRSNLMLLTEHTRQIKELSTELRECNEKYEDLLKMFYFSHDTFKPQSPDSIKKNYERTMENSKNEHLLFIPRSEHLERELILLREFANERINTQEKTRIADWKAHKDVHRALKEQFSNYKHEIELRLNKLNELREDVVKDRELYARRENVESRDENVDTKLAAIDKTVDEIIRWREGQLLRVPTLESLVAKNEVAVTDLKNWRTRTTGIAIGVALGSGVTGGGVGFIIAKLLGG